MGKARMEKKIGEEKIKSWYEASICQNAVRRQLQSGGRLARTLLFTETVVSIMNE